MTTPCSSVINLATATSARRCTTPRFQNPNGGKGSQAADRPRDLVLSRSQPQMPITYTNRKGDLQAPFALEAADEAGAIA